MGEIFAGRYELIDPIGRGGAGAVWRAWDHRRRRYVAAKVLQQSDAHALLRFVREQALRIDHPHVLAPASWAADDDKVLFTMDLVSGGSLSHLIGDYGALPPRFVCTLLDQLLAGLQAVHDEGVVHRDIKPANILLEPTGPGRPRLRLSDFGISMRKGEPRLTEANLIPGTPGYFAPEQMRGAEPDFTADLYAVGLVGLYLLTGKKPDSIGLYGEYEDAGGMPDAPAGVPEALWQVLGTLLQPDPQVRFRTANGARKALASAAELLPEAEERETVEVFDQIGPLPAGYGPNGPERADPGVAGAGVAGAGGAVPETTGYHLAPPVAAPPVDGSATPSGGTPPPPTGPPTPPSSPAGASPLSPYSPAGAYGYPQAPPPVPPPPAGRPVHEQPTTLSPPGAPAGYGAAGPHTPPTPLMATASPAPSPVSAGASVSVSASGSRRGPGPSPVIAVTLLVLALVLIGAGTWAVVTA